MSQFSRACLCLLRKMETAPVKMLDLLKVFRVNDETTASVAWSLSIFPKLAGLWGNTKDHRKQISLAKKRKMIFLHQSRHIV